MTNALHPLPNAVESDAEEPSLEWQGLLHALLRRVWLIACGALLCGLAASVYVQQRAARYESRTVLQVEPEQAHPLRREEGSEIRAQDPMIMETVVQNFRSRALLEGVVRELRLSEKPEFRGLAATSAEATTAAAARLATAYAVLPRPRTLLVDVSFQDSNPRMAQQLANTIVAQFLKQNAEQQVAQAQAQVTMLAQKAGELKARLAQSEAAVQNYKNHLESVSVDTGRNLVEAKLQDLNTNLSGARNERMKFESDLQVIESLPIGDQARWLAVPSVAADATVAAAQVRLKALEVEIQTLSDHYRAKHPRMIEAQSQLLAGQAALAAAVRAAPEHVAASLAGARAGEQTLERAVALQEKELLKLDEKITPYRALQKELEADRSLYEGVQQKLKESAVLMDIRPVNFRVVEPALLGTRLHDHRLLFILAGSIVGALGAAAGVAGLYLLDSSIKTVDDAERLLGLPVLAAVPKMSRTKGPAHLLAIWDQPDSPLAESFRSLRTSISLLGPAAEHKVLLFTSAVPGEGKTVTAANTAAALAQQGLRTVLLDADLRRPRLSRLLREACVKAPGIAEYLVGEEPAVLRTEIPNLFLLPAGAQAPNPAELLASPRFAQLVDTMKAQYDRVVIDTAPVNVVSDTLSIVGTAQAVVLVVRSDGTSRKVVRRALELLRRAHVRADGLVLNCLPQWSGLGHHYYYSSAKKYGEAQTYAPDFLTGNAAKPATLAIAPSGTSPG